MGGANRKRADGSGGHLANIVDEGAGTIGGLDAAPLSPHIPPGMESISTAVNEIVRRLRQKRGSIVRRDVRLDAVIDNQNLFV